MDKYLKIGLGLGSCCTIGSISYWSTQYQSHLPSFFYPQKAIVKNSSRLSNPHYQKIKATENEVGCTFHVIFDPSSSKQNQVFGLLNEENITDNLLEQMSNRIDSDVSVVSDVGFSIENLKKKCKLRTIDKKLRIAAIKDGEGRVTFQARQNEQGGPNYSYID